MLPYAHTKISAVVRLQLHSNEIKRMPFRMDRIEPRMMDLKMDQQNCSILIPR
jgi:hypothetical protein